MIMGIGGHWVFKFYGKHDVYIANNRRNIPFIESSSSAEAYANLALYLANRINRDRLMLAYARKKGHSINSKRGRKPRITYVTFDSNFNPVAVTLGRCSSRRYLDGKPFRKRYRPLKKADK
jgi:hypothetical protein